MPAALDRGEFMTRAATVAASSILTGLTRAAEAPRPSPKATNPSPTAPLRLGLVSAATSGNNAPRTLGSHHGTAFATTFNGWDDAKARLWKGTFVKSGRRLDRARVVKIWDPDRAAAQQLADISGIEHVTDTPEQCSDGVDAVIIVDDGSGAQWKYATHPLRKGVPVLRQAARHDGPRSPSRGSTRP